jgi:hypothetical protein
MIYIPSSFPCGKSNQLLQYATKGDGVKSYHLLEPCVVDLIEATPKHSFWKMNVQHFEEAKEKK